MKHLPMQVAPVSRSSMPKRRLQTSDGISPSGCSFGDQFKCAGIVAGLTGACAAVAVPGAGLAAIGPCIGAITGYVASDCYDCVAGYPLKSTVCGWVDIINKIGIVRVPKPHFC